MGNELSDAGGIVWIPSIQQMQLICPVKERQGQQAMSLSQDWKCGGTLRQTVGCEASQSLSSSSRHTQEKDGILQSYNVKQMVNAGPRTGTALKHAGHSAYSKPDLDRHSLIANNTKRFCSGTATCPNITPQAPCPRLYELKRAADQDFGHTYC